MATFAETIEANKNAAQVPVDIDVLTLPGTEARMRVRRRGSAVVGLTLHSRSQGRPVDVLYAKTPLEVPKPRATHPMLPFGDSPWGNHGWLRYADPSRIRLDTNVLETTTGGVEGFPQVTGIFKLLDAGSAIIATKVHNDSGRQIESSAGSHLYFPRSGRTIEDITVNDTPLSQLLGTAAIEALKKGEPHFWSPPSEGLVIVGLPGLSVMINVLQKRAGQKPSPVAPLSFAIWSSPETSPDGDEFICFEPLLGVRKVDGQLRNDQLVVPPGSSVTLETQLTVL